MDPQTPSGAIERARLAISVGGVVLFLRVPWSGRYADCRMLLRTPYYIIVGEFLIVVAIGSLARWTRSGRWWRSLLAGLAILPCYAVGFWAIEGWR